MDKNSILITGGLGFIGSNYVRKLVHAGRQVINLDAGTYAGNKANLSDLNGSAAHILIVGSINERELVAQLLARYQPGAIVNFAAESHVDRSIKCAQPFVETNVLGTVTLLAATRDYWLNLNAVDQHKFRFVHISTDEVYGSIETGAFVETDPYRPNSPYSASKASSNHFVRSFYETFQLPTVTITASNNYGPYQFPEKLIPLMILQALAQQPLPIYGTGENVRDWLHVADHCAAIDSILAGGKIGEVYNVGGECPLSNLQVVATLCQILDKLRPLQYGSYAQLVKFVANRPGHDLRYSLDITKIRQELGWSPKIDFNSGLASTVEWYLNNESWCKGLQQRYQHSSKENIYA